MRTILVITMISSFYGLGMVDCWNRNWKTGLASLLLGVVQTLIFWSPSK